MHKCPIPSPTGRCDYTPVCRRYFDFQQNKGIFLKTKTKTNTILISDVLVG